MLGLWELAVPMTKTYLMGNQYLLSLLSHLVTDKTTFKYLQEDQKKPHIERHLFFLLTLLKKNPTNKKTPKTILCMTVPEGQTQYRLIGRRQHYCSLNAVHYRLCNFYAAGGS